MKTITTAMTAMIAGMLLLSSAVSFSKTPPTGIRERCADIQAEIDEINKLMRAGYSASEGEAFRARLRQLRSQMHECRNASPGHKSTDKKGSKPKTAKP